MINLTAALIAFVTTVGIVLAVDVIATGVRRRARRPAVTTGSTAETLERSRPEE